jgi:UDP-glucose 4-epimerase
VGPPLFSRILLLGHTGYIGSRLVRALATVDQRIPVIGRAIGDLDLTQPDSSSALESIVDDRTAVVICAAIKKQLGDNSDVFSKNLAITLNIRAALAARPVRRVVFFSSAAVYGEDVEHDVITEATAVQPTSYYGIGKFAAERLLQRPAQPEQGTSLLVLRPALVYGPSEPAYYYGPSGFLRKARSGEAITLWGDGTEQREFLYVDDVVEIAKRLTFSDAGGVINVVSGTSYTYAQALDSIAALVGEAPQVRHRERSKSKVDHRFDAGAVRAACPGFSFTPLEAGLRLTERIDASAVEGMRA